VVVVERPYSLLSTGITRRVHLQLAAAPTRELPGERPSASPRGAGLLTGLWARPDLRAACASPLASRRRSTLR